DARLFADTVCCLVRWKRSSFRRESRDRELAQYRQAADHGVRGCIAETPRSDRDPVLVDLALQGGGSHGAFTWGVLDRLLEESWLRIEGISGTSAGAMNGAVLVAGFAAGGAEGAKSALHAFWERVSHSARFSPIRRSPMDVMLGRWTLDTSPFYLAFDLASRVFSPYDLNPRGTNPLRDVIADS